MNSLQEYIDRVFSFEKNRDSTSYEGRVGPPDELSAVIGRISMNFQVLEDELKTRISQMLDIGEPKGLIVVSELSFRNLINMFSSLYYHLKDDHKFNSIPNYEDDYFKELKKALFKCEELRNQILHSSIIDFWLTKEIFRKKTTAKAKSGLKTSVEKVDIPYLFDVADYIISMKMELEEFFIDFQKTQ